MNTQVSPRVVADASLEAFLYSGESRKLPEVVEVIYGRHDYVLVYSDGTREVCSCEEVELAPQLGYDDGWTY